MFDNKEFYAEYDIYNSNLHIPYDAKGGAFNVYKGNKFEMVLCNSMNAGFTLSAFVFSKKIAKLHENNRLQRKKRVQKLQMQKKSKDKKKIVKKAVKKKNK
jgi:hypothetical protein